MAAGAVSCCSRIPRLAAADVQELLGLYAALRGVAMRGACARAARLARVESANLCKIAVPLPTGLATLEALFARGCPLGVEPPLTPLHDFRSGGPTVASVAAGEPITRSPHDDRGHHYKHALSRALGACCNRCGVIAANGSTPACPRPHIRD